MNGRQYICIVTIRKVRCDIFVTYEDTLLKNQHKVEDGSTKYDSLLHDKPSFSCFIQWVCCAPMYTMSSKIRGYLPIKYEASLF